MATLKQKKKKVNLRSLKTPPSSPPPSLLSTNASKCSSLFFNKHFRFFVSSSSSSIYWFEIFLGPFANPRVFLFSSIFQLEDGSEGGNRRRKSAFDTFVSSLPTKRCFHFGASFLSILSPKVNECKQPVSVKVVCLAKSSAIVFWPRCPPANHSPRTLSSKSGSTCLWLQLCSSCFLS